MDETVHQASWQKSDTWLRGLFMLLLMVFMGIGHALVNIVALVQFLWLLFAGEPNRPLANFGKALAAWMAEVTRFQTGASEEKPFPWKAWPEAL
jgi:hypothetical protein